MLSKIVDRDLLQGCRFALDVSLVERSSLDANPVGDELFASLCGERARTLSRDNFRWSLPAARHRVRISHQGFDSLNSAQEAFSSEFEALREAARGVDSVLLGSAMHPSLQRAHIEAWPHGLAGEEKLLLTSAGIDRHGFGNQSAQIVGLRFESEEEFAAVYMAIRFVLPLLPALSASSPLVEGMLGPAMSCRLAARRDYLASVLGKEWCLVPPAASCRASYRGEVEEPVRKALRDAKHALAPKSVWPHLLYGDFSDGYIALNAIDRQECLQADLAVMTFALELVRHLMQEGVVASLTWEDARLAELLELTLISGEGAIWRDRPVLEAYGFPERGSCRVAELLQFLLQERLEPLMRMHGVHDAIEHIAIRGSLATRMLRSLPPERWNDEDVFVLVRELCRSHAEDRLLD